VQAQGVGSVEMLSWRRRDADMSVELTYIRSEGHELIPVAARLEGSGKTHFINRFCIEMK
jgi:hypothetical protein